MLTVYIINKLYNDILNGVESVTKSKGESWNDEFLKLRRRIDETKNYSKSSDINNRKRIKEKNVIYRVAQEGGKEDDLLTELLNKIFDHNNAINKKV